MIIQLTRRGRDKKKRGFGIERGEFYLKIVPF
jgi:hypothetical protein